jgi:hypothetical protein
LSRVMTVLQFFPNELYKRYLAIFFILAAFLLITKNYLLERRFPPLSNGDYLGTINGAAFDDNEEGTLFYVRQAVDGNLFVSIFRKGIEPRTVPISSVRRWLSFGEDAGALKIESDQGSLEFVGKQNAKGGYSGEVKNLTSPKTGTWEIAKIDIESNIKNIDLETIQSQVTLQSLEDSLHSLVQRSAERQAEITKLNDYLFRGEDLKKRADQKYLSEQAKLLNIGELYRKEQEGMAAEGERYELAERISAYGRLVALGRETFFREAEIIRTSLKGEAPALALPDEDALLERGAQVLELQKQITLERHKVESLLNGSNNGE